MNIGDTVELKKIPDSTYFGLNRDLELGDIGVICCIGESRYGIDWGRDIYTGHDCDGMCEDGHGFFVDKRCVSMIESSESEFQFSEDDFKKCILMTCVESNQ